MDNSIYNSDIGYYLKKNIIDHQLKRLKIDKDEESNLKIGNSKKLNNSIDSNRINRNIRKKIFLEAENLIDSIDTKSFRSLIDDQINLDDIFDELPIKKLDQFIMNKSKKDSQISELNESSINTDKPSIKKSNESSIKNASKLLTENTNESSINTNKSSIKKSNESSTNTDRPSTKKSIETVSKSPTKKFKKLKRDNVELLNKKSEIDKLNENMMEVQLTNSSLKQNEDMNELTALKKSTDDTNKNEIENLNTTLNSIESNNSTLNSTDPIENASLNKLDNNSREILNENITNSNKSYDSAELNFSTNLNLDNSKDHTESISSIENPSTGDNLFREENLNTDKNLLDNSNKDDNSVNLDDFTIDSFTVVDEFQVDDLEYKEKSVDSKINENLSIKTTSNNKCSPFTELFIRLKVNSEIIESIKLLNLKNNEVSFNQQKEISEFLFNNTDSNLYIRTKPFHKKLSYLVYVLNQINTKFSYSQAVIVTSTVELSHQIKSLIKLLVKFRPDINSIVLSPDIDYFERMKHHLICCTSGTLIHCLNSGLMDLYRVKLCIFEEFDVLNSVKYDRKGIDDNKGHFQRLLKNFNYDCQQIYFSTNLDSSSLKSAKFLANNKLKILNLLDENTNQFDNILNLYVNCQDRTDKYDNLIKLFRNMTFKKVVIFSNGKGLPIDLKEKLDEDNKRYKLNLKIGLLTGSCQIDYRLKSLKEFKKNKRNVLIITFPINVGLELGDVDLIINYDITTYENRFLYREFFGKTIYLNRFKPAVMFAITFLPKNDKSTIEKLSNKFHIKMYRLDLFSK